MTLERQVAVRHAVGSSVDRRRHARDTIATALWRALTAAMFTPFVLLAFDIPSHDTSHVDHTRALVRRYAFEAFPQWALVHHELPCPGSIAELSAVVGRDHARDAWGVELELRCGGVLRGAYVRSAGPDQTFDTADDISSNDGGGDG